MLNQRERKVKWSSDLFNSSGFAPVYTVFSTSIIIVATFNRYLNVKKLLTTP